MATQRTLFELKNVREYYPEAPTEHVLGTLTVSLVEVPFGGTAASGSARASHDTYLNLALPSGRDLPAPASTRIRQLSPTLFEIEPSEQLRAYLDAAGGSASQRTLLDCSALHSETPEDDIEVLQAIFAQFTIFADPHNDAQKQKVVLVDTQSGATVAALQNMAVHETQPLPDDKSPVVLQVDQQNSTISVRPATAAEEAASPPPGTPEETAAYHYDPNDTILSTAAGISRGLVYASETLTRGLDRAATWYTTSRAPTDKPLEFQETTKRRVRRAAQVTGTGAHYTHKATGAIQNMAASLGERLASRKAAQQKPGEEPKPPGFLNRSLIAFSTVMDGVDTATQTLLQGTAASSTRVIGHAYGPEARELSRDFGSSVASVTTVYIDATGVSRRAILRGVGKGAIRGVMGSKKVVLVEAGREAQFVSDAEKAQLGGPSPGASAPPSRQGSVSGGASAGAPALPQRPGQDSGVFKR